MPTTNVAVRLGVEGEAEIVRAGRTIRTELAGGYAAAGQAANEAGSQADAALSRQEARWRRVAQAQRELAQAEAEQGRINMSLGVAQTPAANSGLTAEYFAEMDRASRAAQSLRAAIDPVWAAQGRLNSELAEAQGLYDRGAIEAAELAQRQSQLRVAFEQTVGSIERQSVALRTADQAAAEARFNAFMGVEARPAAASGLTADYYAEFERAEAAAAQLRAQIDPLTAAQDRYNKEVAEAKALLDRGVISTREYAQAQDLAKGKLDATTLALQNQERGLSRLAVASRLNLARQGADVLTTAAMGMNPAMIAIQQGPQILDAWSTSGIKATGAMVALGGAVGVVTAAALAMGAAWYQADRDLAAADITASGLGRTLGMTGEELVNLARMTAEASDVGAGEALSLANAYASTGRIGRDNIRDLIELHEDYAAFMQMDGEAAQQALARAMLAPTEAGREMTRTFGLLTQAQIEHIAALEEQGDLTAAQEALIESLDSAMAGHADRIGEIESFWDAAADAVSRYWNALGQALQVTESERIATLERQLGLEPGEDPDLTAGRQPTASDLARGGPSASRSSDAASELLMLRYGQMTDEWRRQGAPENQEAQLAADRAERDRQRQRRGGRSVEERVADQVRDIEAASQALELQTAQWLGLARAEEEAGASLADVQAAWASGAAMEEARRQATVEGIVREDLARARLRESISRQTADTAQQAGELSLETAIREDLNARVAAGTLRLADYDHAQDQSAVAQQLRIALFSAEQDQMDDLVAVYRALSEAMDDARAADAERDRLAFIERAIDDADDLLARIGLINAGATEAEQRIADAVRDARRELEDRNIDPESPRGQEAIGAARTVAEAENDLERAEAARRYSDELTRQNELVQAQLSLVWLDERARDRILRRLELINDLVADGLKLEDEKVQAILRQHDAYEDMSDLLDRQMQLTGGLREDAYDTWTEMRQALSDGQEGWERMGDIGEDALKRIAAQVLALAILNPFENWAFGSNLPTFGNMGEGFWSAAANGAGNWFSNFLGRIPGFATGTDDAPEGMAWVGEHGKELMQVPGGTRIYNHGQSMGIASRSREAAPVVNLNINLSAEGADAEALARLERRLDDLPGEMLELVGEADSRFILRRR